jgi:hypothetical protein
MMISFAHIPHGPHLLYQWIEFAWAIVAEPILAYAAGGEINHVQWSALHSDWVAITFGEKLQALRV